MMPEAPPPVAGRMPGGRGVWHVTGHGFTRLLESRSSGAMVARVNGIEDLGDSVMTTKSSPSRASVSERALVARVNRQLVKRGERLRRYPPNSSGRYIIVRAGHDRIVTVDVGLVALAEGLGVFQKWEELMES